MSPVADWPIRRSVDRCWFAGDEGRRPAIALQPYCGRIRRRRRASQRARRVSFICCGDIVRSGRRRNPPHHSRRAGGRARRRDGRRCGTGRRKRHRSAGGRGAAQSCPQRRGSRRRPILSFARAHQPEGNGGPSDEDGRPAPAERSQILRELTKAMNDGRLAGEF